MKVRSSKQETKERMSNHKISKLKQDPHLSGAYIRSLVKQLTTSRPKTHPKASDDGFNSQNSAQFGDGFSETSPQMTEQKPQPQHKKQVRRRLHTSRPYQERLLNMAEARREIVSALKFHRASMKHAKQQQQQQQQTQNSILSQLSSPPPPFEQESKTKSRRNPCSWPDSHPSATDAMNFTLPNQTLGLNLNFHDFNTIDTSLCHNSNNPSVYSSSSSSPTLSVVTEEVPLVALSQEVEQGGLHQAMDDEGMAEIRSLGEQHQMEWNDTMNLVTSTWWLKFLKSMELEAPEVKSEDDDDNDGYQPFDQVMEFPDWLNANDTCCFQQHFTDLCPDEYFQDPALPCMDIGEIEGMDGEWLS